MIRAVGGFQGWDLRTGELADLSEDPCPTVIRGWNRGALELPAEGTHFGVVSDGQARLRAEQGDFILGPNMWFALPGAGSLESADGGGVVVTATRHRGLFCVGGPIEKEGRLRYIDGCTDTLLVAPPKLGDPCLNALYFPRGTDQTEHTHPSLRAGLVISGGGVCRTPDGEVPLTPGLAFLIPAEGLHSFATQETPMVVAAYHPDSDFGPTDEEHPMINRTIVEGVPANRLSVGG
jgi:hypothetical protein